VIALVIAFALEVASVCFGYFAKQCRWPAAAINLVEVVVGGYYTLSSSPGARYRPVEPFIEHCRRIWKPRRRRAA
jgi:hypothetical protein